MSYIGPPRRKLVVKSVTRFHLEDMRHDWVIEEILPNVWRDHNQFNLVGFELFLGADA